MNAAVSMPVLVFLFAYAHEVISVLYTDKFLAAEAIWQVSIFAVGLRILAFGSIPRAFGKTKSVMRASVFRLAIAVPLTVALVSTLGLVGGPIAFVIAFGVEAIMQLAETKKVLSLELRNLLPWSKLFMSAAWSIALIIGIQQLLRFDLSNVASVLVGAALYFPVVAVVFLSTNLVKLSELRSLYKKG